MRFVSVLAVLALILPVAATAQSGLSISNYQLQSSVPVTGSIMEETYTGLLFNSGTSLSSVTATLTSNDPSIVPVPGRNVLTFAPVPGPSAVTSNNTFTIRVDRSQSVFFSQLRWSYQVGGQNPVANAGPDQTAKFLQSVTLNGSASTNPSGQGTLTYSWAFVTVPVGSTAVLSNANTVSPSFIVNPAGQYVVRLTVSNGSASSSATVTINATNTAPVANAGAAQTIPLGSTVTLNGSGSTDVDGNPLTYSWLLQSVPANSTATLSNPTAANPTFVADKAGTYVARLIVSDSALFSTPANVTITTSGGNTPPVANAGVNQSVSLGSLVNLTGAASTDADGNPLTYQWSFNSKPAGSSAALSSTTAVNPTFTADLAGNYVVQLVVNDGQINSLASTVTIATNGVQAPTANAGLDQHVNVGAMVVVSGSGTDPQSRPLTKQYTLTSKPFGSTATIVLNGFGDATFIADSPGSYVVQLIVNNGILSSAPDTMTVSTNNTVPVANPGLPLSRTVGVSVELDGRGSTDADADALTYLWSFTSKPVGSTAVLSGATTGTPSFLADVAGDFVIQLIVNDGQLSSAPKTVTVTVVAPNSVSFTPSPVEMTTEGPITVTAHLASPASSPAGLTVTVTTLPGSPALVTFPSSIFFPQGSSDQTFTITPVAAGTTALLVIVPNMQPVNLPVHVTGLALSLSLDSSVIGLGSQTNGQVTRSIVTNSPITVNLSAVPANVTVPATVVIPAGASSANFSAVGSSTGFADLTATAAGFTPATTSVQVAQLGQINLPSNVALIAGQAAVPYSVTLSTAAGPFGARVTLTSSNPNVVTISPAQVDIAPGAFGPSTSPMVTGVAFGTAAITATAPGYQNKTQSISVAGTLGWGQAQLTGAVGTTQTATLVLNSNAASDLNITLLSDNPAVASVPASVTIQAGTSSKAISVVFGASAGLTTIRAQGIPGLPEAALPVVVGTLGSIVLPAGQSVGVNASATFPISISQAAPSGGLVVTLGSTDTSKLTIAPSTVTIPAGQTTPSTQPQISGVATGTASIQATGSGLTAASQSVTVNPASLNSVTFNPTPVNLTGAPVTVTAHLATAPSSALTVNVTRFSGASVASFPTTIVFSAGTQDQTFTLTPSASGSMTLLFTAPEMQPGSLPVNVTGSTLALILDAGVIGLGNHTTGHVTRPIASASAVTVALSVSNSNLVVNPTSVVIAANETTSAPFDVQGVSNGTSDITATAGGYTSASTLVVVSQLGEIVLPGTTSLTPSQVQSYPVHLSGPAGQDGVHITLSSSNQAAVTINPTDIFVPANATVPSVTPQVTGVGFGAANIIASAPGYFSLTQEVRVTGTLAWEQNLLAGGTNTTTTATVTLNAPASTALTVNLHSDNATIASVPATVTIAAGATTASVTVTLGSAGSTTLRASALPTLAEVTIPVTVASLGSIVLPVGQSIGVGITAPFPVSISQPAPSGGVTITLSSTDQSKVTIAPTTVTIATGQTAPASQPQITGVNLGSANIQATGTGVGSATQAVAVRAATSLTPPSLTINGLSTQNLTLNLGAPAPADVVVQLTSSNSLVVTVPASVTILAGATSIAVPVTSVSSGEVLITATPASFYNSATSSVLVFIQVAGNIAIEGTTNLTLGQTSTIPLSISPAAGAGGVTVTLSSSSPAVTVTSSVTIPAGATSPTPLPSVTGANFGSAVITATAGGYTPGTRSVNVGGALAFGSAPVSISGTSTVALVLSLPSSAPSAFTVNLSSSNPGAASVPATATFAAGASTVNVMVTGVAPGSATITASAAGLSSAAVNVTTTPLADISIPAGVVMGPGEDRTFPITLKTAAPAGGVYVTLASSNTSKVTINPPLVYVPQGSVTSIATPRVAAVDFGSAIISASAPGLLGNSQSVSVAIQMSFLQPNITISGINATQTLALALSSPSPAGGVTVNLVSNNPGIARIQPSIFIPANVSIVSVLVTGVGPGLASISASGGIVGSATATAKVLAPGLLSIASNVTVAVGQYAALPITLGAPATSPVTVTLTSSNSRKLFVTTSTVVIPTGATEPTVQPMVGADNIGVVTITATAPGFNTATAQVSGTTTITWNPTSISMAPAETRIALLALAMPAPPGHTIAGRCEIVDSDFCSTTIFLKSDNPAVALVQPEVTYYPDGSNPSTAQLVITAGTPGTTTIHASALPYVQDVTLTITVLGPGAISLPAGLVVSPGQGATFAVNLSSPAPAGGLTVFLASNDNSTVGISPSSVFIPAGATAPQVQPQVTGGNFGVATITATAPSFTSASQTVQVRGSLTLTPPTLTLNTGNSSLTLTLSSPAPAPLTVTLASSNPSVVAVAPSVTIGTGNTGVVVGISAGNPGTAQVTASAGPQITAATANITVGNVTLGGLTLAAGLSTSPGQTISIPLTLTSPAPSGGVTVSLTSSSSAATVTPSVFIPAGATSPAAQPQVTGVQFGNPAITAAAANFTSASQTVAVGATLSFGPNSISVVRTASKNLQLILSVPAPAGGVAVNLGSSNVAIATVPSSITIAAGATSVNVPVTGVALGSATISATSSAANVSGASATVTVTTPDIQIPASLTVGVGSQVSVPVTLSQPAPAGGVSVVLTSSDTNKATINPSTVFIAQGGTTPVAQPVAIGVSAGTVVVAASASGLVGSSANLQVGAGMSFTPPSLTISGSGTSQFLKLNLPSAAPLGGQLVTLTSSNTGVATVPAFINVPQGASSANISVTSVGAGSATVTATSSGLPNATAAVTVTAGGAINLPVELVVPMGPGALFPITLATPAPPGGVTLSLSVGNTARAAISSSTVYVAAGATTPAVQPSVTALNVGPNTITVSGSGYGTATASIKGTATVQFVSGTTTTVRLGETGRLYMALGAAAPPGHTIAGRCEIVDSDFCSISVNLTTGTPGIVYVQPQFTYYPDGSNPPIGLVLFSPTAVGTTTLKAGAPPYIPETTITINVTN